MAKTTRRSREETADLVKKVHELVLGGSTVKDAAEKFDLAEQVYRTGAKRMGLIRKGTVKRRSKVQIVNDVRRAHALVMRGATITEAIEKIGLADGVYRGWTKKLGLPPAGVVTGSVSADMLPPRPGKGGKRTPRAIDMNDVQSLASNIGKIDKKLASVAGLGKERKTLAKRLMELLRRKP